MSKRGRPRRWALPAVFVVVTLLAAGGSVLLLHRPATAAADTDVVPAVRGDLAVTVAAAGTVASRTTTPLTFAADGTIARVDAEPGVLVARGDVLAVLDDGVARARLEAATRTLAADTAARDTLRSTPSADADPAAGDPAAGDPADADPADADPADAGTTPIAPADPVALDRIEGAIAADQGAVAEARDALDATLLRAPQDGTVTALSARVGARVSAGTGTAVVGSVTDLGALGVTVGVGAGEVARVLPGQRAEVVVDGADERLTATVAEVAPAPGPSGLYPVALTVEVPPASLRIGQRAVATVVVAEAGGSVLVPRGALRGTGDATSLLVRRPDGDRVAPVGIGLADDRAVQITRGVMPGDLVVVPVDASDDDDDDDEGATP